MRADTPPEARGRCRQISRREDLAANPPACRRDYAKSPVACHVRERRFGDRTGRAYLARRLLPVDPPGALAVLGGAGGAPDFDETDIARAGGGTRRARRQAGG